MKRTAVLTLLALSVVACQDDISTPFPPGLEPLEDNKIAATPNGPFTEGLRIESSNNDYIRVYARGFVTVPMATMWAMAKSPAPNVSTCSTTEQIVTENDEPQYEYSFVIHYIVRDIVTVEWDDQWRFGAITDDLDQIKHQKVQGSDYITLSEGTIQVLSTSDPGVSELSFVEHLDAFSASAADVVQGVQHNYDALVAAAHGAAIPPCP
ncbi:MAG TPA: hypothetical protein VLB44_15705 [Kofleriaceae bacterium]|nr:hypothetical protein [Kofleriaceae bacterium]